MRIKRWEMQKQASKQFSRATNDSTFKHHHHISYSTTTVYLLRPPHSLSSSAPPWIIAGVNDAYFLHPLTFKYHLFNRPRNFHFSNFHKSILAVFHTPTSSFDKLLLIPQRKLNNNRNNDRNAMLVLHGGGRLMGRLPGESAQWMKFSGGVNADKFDDVTIYKGKIYALDRQGKVYVINYHAKSRKLKLGKTLITRPVTPGSGLFGWRKRFVVDGKELYLVVRMEEKLFRVYKLIRRGKLVDWDEIRVFDGGKVLFMARDCYFFRRARLEFPGREYKNCIVFSEAAFPQYGKDCWEFTQSVRILGFVRKSEDDIEVFRLSDQCFAREGDNLGFPKINWSLPSWIFRVSTASDVEFQSHSVSYSCQSESESDEDEGFNSNNRDDEKDGELQSDLKDSNSKDEIDGEMQSDLIGQDKEQEELESVSDSQDQEDGKMQCDLDCQDQEHEVRESVSDSQDQDDGKMQCDSNSQEKEDEQMHAHANIDGDASLQENVSPSLFGPESETTFPVSASLSAAEEEVTRTLPGMKGGNGDSQDQEEETSRQHIIQSVPRASTSSTTESHKSDSAIAKFEGFDIRSDLVPILQKIWRKHGNIVENSIMRSGDIIARALESLATMVRILEENSAQSLSDCQADYLSSTLSDLRCICFKMHWLIPFVEKAVKLHKSKPLVNSLNNLSLLSSQVKEREAILLDELTKIREEGSKLEEEMAKVSKLIPFSGQVKFDEPLGLWLT